jgi:hypothetical protein
MPTAPETSKNAARTSTQTDSATSTRAQSPNGAPQSRTEIEVTGSQPAGVRTANRTELPAKNSPVVSKPLSAYDDNPVLDSQGAAFVLGVSVDLLKKWRKRMLGPDYIQYGAGGTVRCELKTLMDFRDCYKIYLNSGRYGRLRAPAEA